MLTLLKTVLLTVLLYYFPSHAYSVLYKISFRVFMFSMFPTIAFTSVYDGSTTLFPTCQASNDGLD